jgi:hypothetical protein
MPMGIPASPSRTTPLVPYPLLACFWMGPGCPHLHVVLYAGIVPAMHTIWYRWQSLPFESPSASLSSFRKRIMFSKPGVIDSLRICRIASDILPRVHTPTCSRHRPDCCDLIQIRKRRFAAHLNPNISVAQAYPLHQRANRMIVLSKPGPSVLDMWLSIADRVCQTGQVVDDGRSLPLLSRNTAIS